MPKNKLTIKILLFLIFSDVLETFTQFCFKKSALLNSGLEIKTLANALSFAQTVTTSHFLWIALLSVLLTFIIWSTILSKIDLSIAVPIASFSYIFVPIASIVFLHEKVSLLRWCGILLILLGVILVSMSSKVKETA